jgi:hypothetical protein
MTKKGASNHGDLDQTKYNSPGGLSLQSYESAVVEFDFGNG